MSLSERVKDVIRGMTAVGDEKENFIADSHAGKECLKLPEIKLRKFSGEVREWLRFWSQFKCMHDDSEIKKEDKFHCLIQAMTEGIRSHDTACSFPLMVPGDDKWQICSIPSESSLPEDMITAFLRTSVKPADDDTSKLIYSDSDISCCFSLRMK